MQNKEEPWHQSTHWSTDTFGDRRYTEKHTLNTGTQTPKSEDVLVSKQPRVQERSHPHHQSLTNYSHAPSLQHKSALISTCCRIREYQLQHLLHLQTQPLKAQQSGSAGINNERGHRKKRGGRIGKQKMQDRQWKAQGCLFLLVVFGHIRVAICQKKKKKKILRLISK